MSESTLDRLTRLLDEAAPRPWRVPSSGVVYRSLQDIESGPPDNPELLGVMHRPGPSDAELITEAVNYLPSLLRIARAAETMLYRSAHAHRGGIPQPGCAGCALNAALRALGETPKHQRGVVVERNRPLPVAEDPGDFDHLLGETPDGPL